MKRLLVLTSIFLGLIALQFQAHAQNPQLSISAVGFPDTAHVNQTYDFSFIITNVSPANTFTGSVQILFSTQDSSGSFGANQAGNLAPFDTFAVHVDSFHFDPSLQPQFRTGDNVVVVWPSIGGNPNGDSIILHLFIPDPAGIDDNQRSEINPAIHISKVGEDQLGISVANQENAVDQVRIYNLAGQVILHEKNANVLNLAGISTGVYVIEVTSKGEKLYQKFFKN